MLGNESSARSLIPMPLPRVRLRAVMIAVAVAGMLLSGYRFLGVSLYRRKAELMYALAERDATADAGRLERAGGPGRLALAERARQRATYFAALKRKYRDAAARPWLLVAPDPPLPE